MKILEAPSEVPDDAQVTLKSETSHLDQEQKSKELEEKRQKESEPGRLTRLIKFTTGEAREMTKHCIQLPHNRGYQHARTLLERAYGNPHKILSSHRKEIKELSLLKFGDAKGFCKFYKFLWKCESVSESQDWNALGTLEMLCTLISKLPGGLMDRRNKTVQAIRRKQIREPDLQDLIQFVEEETTLVNDLLFSREALHEYTKGPGKQNQRRLKQMKKCFTKADKNKDACESL